MGLLQDVKFGLRMLAKNPWFTFVATITLALGIGVNGAGFSIVNAALWKKVPFGNSQELVHIGMTNDAGQAYEPAMSYPEFAAFRSQSHSFKSLAAFVPLEAAVADSTQGPQRYPGVQITSNLFSFLGISPIRGRDFTPENEKIGAEPVALIGYDVWQTRYQGQDDAVGRKIRVNGTRTTIVGVMPKGMKFPNHEAIWLPLVPDHQFEARDIRPVEVLGRLASGVSIEQSRAELKAIAQKLAADYPKTNAGYQPAVLTFLDWSDGPEVQTVFVAMLGAVGFVLLIACANVANLLLSRVVQRSRETSIRTALGASRWRIVRQLLIESLMLSFLGGSLGLLFSEGGIRWFDNAVADVDDAPYWVDLSMDYHVFTYLFFICILTAIIFGLMPALQVSKTNVNDNLKDGGRGTAGGFRARRMTSILLVGEIALTVVLLVGAGLLGRSFLAAQRLDFGMDTSHLLAARIKLPPASYPNPSDDIMFVDRLVERLKAQPDINATITSSSAPVVGAQGKRLQLQDRDIADAGKNLPYVGVLSVDTGYFKGLASTLVRGRDFSPADGRPGAEVAIVNEPFAAKYWPGENPVGKRLRLESDSGPWLSVVGVTPPVLQARTIGRMPGPLVYIPYRQSPAAEFNVLMRASGPRDSAVAALRAEVSNIDPDLPLLSVMTVDDYLRSEMWAARVFGAVFGAFAVMALLMSSIGLYGVTAYGITQRTQEIGVRMALGATPLNVVWLVLRQGLSRIVLGIGLGLLGALGVSDILTVLLYGVTSTDPVTYASISILLGLVATIACLLPARRATQLDPVDALRRE